MFTRSSFIELVSHRRDPIVIVTGILLCAVNGAGKTRIIYKVGLSSAQVDKYFPLLLRSELLVALGRNMKPLYKTTSKGKVFLETFDVLNRLLDQN
jgi:predicted transcriptional regulator